MRNRFVAGLTLFSFLSATSLPALALSADKSGVESTSGQVLVWSDTNSWEALGNSELEVGDVVRTGGDGQAIVRLGDSRVRVAANTQLRIVSLEGKPEINLERGRLLGRVENGLTVSTAKTKTSATTGEFVLETTATGSALRVLSGNARLQALTEEAVKTDSLAQVADVAGQESLSTVGDLGNIQSVGDVALLGEWKTKGKGTRVRTTDESVGGDEDATPDQDIQPPRQPDPPIVEEPVTPPTTPPTTPPPTTPPATPPAAPPAAAAAGVSPALIAGGLLLIGGIVALVVSGDDDNDNVVVPGTPGVPSPSLP